MRTLGTNRHVVFRSFSTVTKVLTSIQEVPLEASVAGQRPKPFVSRFKADRFVGASTSLDSSVSPVSQAHIVQRAIRTGKVEGSSLIGHGEGDSDEEDIKAVMALLKQGEVINVGPGVAASANPNQTSLPAAQDPADTKVTSKPRVGTSKFKLARKETSSSTSLTQQTPLSQASPSASEIAVQSIPISSATPQAGPRVLRRAGIESSVGVDTPLPEINRSPQKMPVSDTVMERRPARSVPSSNGRPIPIPSTSPRAQGHISQTANSGLQQPTVVVSPSFIPPSSSHSMPSEISTSASSHGASFVIDSPSFQPPLEEVGPEARRI
jgi:hypothetical protein